MMHVYVLLMRSRGSLQIFLLISDSDLELLVFRFMKSYLISPRTLAVETLHKFTVVSDTFDSFTANRQLVFPIKQYLFKAKAQLMPVSAHKGGGDHWVTQECQDKPVFSPFPVKTSSKLALCQYFLPATPLLCYAFVCSISHQSH